MKSLMKNKLFAILITALLGGVAIGAGSYIGFNPNTQIVWKPVEFAEYVFQEGTEGNSDTSVVNSNQSSLQRNIRGIRKQFNHKHGIVNIIYNDDSNTLNFYFAKKPTDNQARYATKLGQDIKADNHDDGLVIQLKLTD